MRHFLFFFISFFVICSIVVSAHALEDNPLSFYPFEDVVDDDVLNDPPSEFELVDGQVVPVEEVDPDPVPVIVVPDPEGEVYPSLYAAGSPGLSIGTTPPSDSPFFGSGWITGTDSRLGRVTLYFPIDFQRGHWGVDSNGYLMNITSSSMSGYLDGVYNNSVSASGFTYPRYRDQSGSSWEYYDLHLIPENSNMEIAVEHENLVPVEDVLPYFVILLLGGLFVCFMKRS